MSNIKDKTDKGVQMDSKKMDDLQAQLDIEVFEQDKMDVDKVKAILAEMEENTPDTEKKTFDKEKLWKRIEEQSREEFAAEEMLAFDKSKAGKKNISGGRIRRIAFTAATIVLALFIGANIGTYATERKNVFEYVGDLRNGTAFWITGDAPSMEMDKEKIVYYSWNDVPDEYRHSLVIPQGVPENIKLYDIEIVDKDVFEWATIRYVADDGAANFIIKIALYNNEEFSFGNIKYEDSYELIEQKTIENMNLYYYNSGQDEVAVQFLKDEYIYTFSGNLDMEVMYSIIEKTMEYEF